MKPTVSFAGATIAPEEFFARYQRSAAALHALGVGEGDVVALMLRNEPMVLELMLATRWLGAHWCPVNWHYKAEELRYILEDSGTKLFIAHGDLLEPLREAVPACVPVYRVTPPGADGTAGSPAPDEWSTFRDAASRPVPEARPARGAMLYTSGTTGRSKGIRRKPATPEQSAAGLAVQRLTLGLAPGMRALVSAPMYHSAPNSFSVGVAQESGHLWIEQRFDAEQTLRMIEEHRISHTYLVPTMYVRLLRLPEETRKRYDISSMRFVASTGSPCAPEVKRAMIEWWGPVINEAYGSSELGYMTVLTSADALKKPGSAGRPLPGVSMRILDEDGKPQPAGSAGLIYVSQPAYADFTYNNNHAARARMERDGHMTMGDVGYLDEDGFLFIVDRSADMVISGGVNIYPAEIEAVLHLMPGVADCAVFGIPDTEFGEALAAAVQPLPGASLQAAQVIAYLQQHLAGFKVPRVVTFHAEMPREDTGKIFKRRLREPYWEGRARRI